MARSCGVPSVSGSPRRFSAHVMAAADLAVRHTQRRSRIARLTTIPEASPDVALSSTQPGKAAARRRTTGASSRFQPDAELRAISTCATPAQCRATA